MSVIAELSDGRACVVDLDGVETVAALVDGVHAELGLPRGTADYTYTVADRAGVGEVALHERLESRLSHIGILGCEERITVCASYDCIATDLLLDEGIATPDEARAALSDVLATGGDAANKQLRLIKASGLLSLTDVTDAMHKAVASATDAGDSPRLDWLLAAGGDANGGVVPPLWIAAMDGRGDIVRVLLKHGADAEITDASGHTPLFEAAACERADVVRALCDHGAAVDVASDDGRTPLFCAAERHRVASMAALLDRGADVNRRDVGGCTPLIVAAGARGGFAAPPGASGESGEGGRQAVADAVTLLVERGADVNARAASGSTALHAAAGCGNHPAITALLDLGAAVDAADANGETPLLRAATTIDIPAGRVLLRRGADAGALVKKHAAYRKAVRRPHTQALTHVFTQVSPLGMDLSPTALRFPA